MSGSRSNPGTPGRVTILGGGPAGCGVAHYAHKAGLPFTLLEAASEVGGNCRTLQHGAFRFDSGAHRFLGTFPDIADEIGALFGADWRRITAPSQIYRGGRMLGFPLAPFDILNNLGPLTFTHALASWGREVARHRPQDSFEAVARRAYGRVIAEEFLLNYSQKLWGLPCDQLSTAVSGKRLKGIDIRTFLFEALRGRKATIEMQDGFFYYPPGGMGCIWDRMAARFPADSVRTGARVTRLLHDGRRITGIEVNGAEVLEPGAIFSTLALPDVFALLDPAPASALAAMARSLAFRSMRLVALFLDRPSVSPNGAVYFPGADLPFTRVTEPRNRDHTMAPAGQTSLLAEVPCAEGEPLFDLDDDALTELVSDHLHGTGWVDRGAVFDSTTARISYAYPVLRKGVEGVVAPLLQHLGRFENLHVSGRNARFEYALIHDVFRQGQQNVARYLERAGAARG